MNVRVGRGVYISLGPGHGLCLGGFDLLSLAID